MKSILLGGSLSGRVVIVDDEDYAFLSAWSWLCSSKGYAVRYERTPVGRRQVRMHRVIMGLARGDVRQVDHRNGDPLDNRRSNLRVATHRQNMQNRRSARGSASAYRGVYLDRGRWRAEVTVDGRKYRIGRFVDELDAARAARSFRLERMPFSVEAAIL